MRLRNIFSFAVTVAFLLFAESDIQAQAAGSPSVDILNKIRLVENGLNGSTGINI
jgi:hypothetical protein